MREQDLGPPVIAHLEAENWDVYQEVPGPGGGVADLVATLGTRLCTVELKLGLGFDVLDQALRWKPYAHWTWVAVPAERVGTGARQLARIVCESYGIGVIEVRHDVARVVSPPAIQRRALVSKLRDRLRPEHKTFAPAGSATGRAWTPFQETCKNLRAFLASQGGAADLAAVVANVKHHYSSGKVARACMVQWAEARKIPGVEVVRERPKVQLRLVETPPA